MLETEFKKLNSCPLTIEYINGVFCNAMLKRGACYLSLDHNCNRCLPILQGAITRTEEIANNKEAFMIHMLKALGKGEEDMWESVEKKAIQQGIFYEPGENIFLKLRENL